MPEKKNQSEATSRAERREEKQKESTAKPKAKPVKKEKNNKEASKKQKTKKERRRLIPIWLRIIIVLLICALALLAGVMIGYGVIGEGNPLDALKLETWEHIIDIVTREQ
ncbi:DNA-directed RNA polymerase subunit beta [Pontibacillus yanchengensis]|uniref:DNA-directed RNA polymerase subunit beta n=2 Tax=Pontibacillus yanchengensis TaxID=462910 RepID=A0A6I4ZVQ9_9BACI|nr:DNA-directed RNA polymerase subunit beta [Pontibacillus yanchengensis]MYL34248.1 DNA-directed RNA polymerase subunit beta [Pontibacillus yanchengensis]MYL53719.1 DNA-directed RNA polymerase subunit beta [Pontibacillus yanchengensis]